MILIVLRLLLGSLLAYTIYEAWKNGQTNLERGDILNAYYVAVSVGLAMLNAMAWAPFFGAKLSDSITNTITKSTYVERYNYLLRLIRWLDRRGFRAPARWLCFVEGVRRPSQPTQFAIGLNNARPGSWLEKVFAREVFRFHNIQNCVQAYHVLRQHGIDPRPHVNPEVNIVLMSLEREARPEPELLPVPHAENPARPARNPRIKLFADAPNSDGPAQVKIAQPSAIAGKETIERTSDAGLGSPGEPAPAAHPAWLQTFWSRLWRFLETH